MGRRSLTVPEIHALTPDQLAATIAEVEEDLAAMAAKIAGAKADRITTGQWADPQWWARLTSARRFKGLEHQRLLRRQAELKREDRGRLLPVADYTFSAGIVVAEQARGDVDLAQLDGRFVLSRVADEAGT